jgi:hypothetical protein
MSLTPRSMRGGGLPQRERCERLPSRVRGSRPGKRVILTRALRAGPGSRPACERLQAASRNATPPRAKVRAMSEPCGGGAPPGGATRRSGGVAFRPVGGRSPSQRRRRGGRRPTKGCEAFSPWGGPAHGGGGTPPVFSRSAAAAVKAGPGGSPVSRALSRAALLSCPRLYACGCRCICGGGSCASAGDFGAGVRAGLGGSPARRAARRRR